LKIKKLYILAIVSVFTLASFYSLTSKPVIEVKLISYTTGFNHPADIIEFNGDFIVPELLDSRVAVTDKSFSVTKQYLKHPVDGQQFSSPHHVAVDNNSLFISGGWGRSIYQFDKNFTQFTEHPADRTLLNAPHGICRQGEWLYIADSLNSRLLRVSLNSPEEYVEFSDIDKLIAYGRQIQCTKDAVWISNSYEKREGLNTGNGANILKISDFNSGKAEVVAEFPTTNITGIYLHNDRFLFIAQWHANKVSIYDTLKKQHLEQTLELPKDNPGIAYGTYYSNTTDKLYIAFIGDIYGKQHKGGIGVYDIKLN